jgi:hypothetical protein
MSATTLTLTIEPGALDARSSWAEFESLAVQMSREVPLRALEAALADAQERLIDSVCGPRWSPVRGLAAPFACPRCGTAGDFARKGKRTRKRKLHTAAGVVELVLWHVGCRECGRVFAPLLLMLGLSGKRRTDRGDGGPGRAIQPGQFRPGGADLPAVGRHYRHRRAGAGESAAGVSPAAARRTVRESRPSHGSHRRTSGHSAVPPVSKHPRKCRCYLGQLPTGFPFGATQPLVFPHRPFHQEGVDALL